MNRNGIILLVMGLAGGLGGQGFSQEILYLDPNRMCGRAGIGEGQYLLSPVDTPVVSQTPLFLDEAQRAPRVITQGWAGPIGGIGTNQVAFSPLAAGAVGPGQPLPPDPSLPPVFPANLRVDLGFQYMRPVFPNRSVTLQVPSTVNGNFTTLGGTGNVSFDFSFIPQINLYYQFADLGFGVTASARMTSIAGQLTRTISSAAGTANLTANSVVNFATVNIVEGFKVIPLNQCPCFECTWLHDTVIMATLGTRYSYLLQEYHANLISGANSTSVNAHQDFNGFGLTTSLSYFHPLCEDWFLYGSSRGSFLLGLNNRNSDFSVVVPGVSGVSTSGKLAENKSSFIPTGEFEVGIAWGRLQPRSVLSQTLRTGPLLWVKGGFVADVWGNLGLLSASPLAQGFSGGALFLYGFSVMAGLDF